MAKFFNANIKYLRQSRGISQDDVAKAVGIDRSLLSRIENDKIETSLDTAVALADFFKIPIGDIVGENLKVVNNEWLDDSHKLDTIVMGKTKELSDDDKQKLIDLIDILKK